MPDKPAIYATLEKKGQEIGFTMPSDFQVGALLKTLITSKPGGNFLELGTGIGLSLSWMIDGMDEQSNLILAKINALTSFARMERHGSKTTMVEDLIWCLPMPGQENSVKLRRYSH